MRGLAWTFAIAAMLAFGCGGRLDTQTDGGTDASTTPDGNAGACCPPSGSPGCCMAFGGYSEGNACSQVCDGLPDPSAPGWKLVNDSHGCPVWTPPPNAPTSCGVKPPPPVCPTPADVSTFVAPPFVPPQVDLTACSAAQVDAIFQACYATSNTSACAAFHTNPANAKCVACLETPSTASAWGPLVTSQTKVELNESGCLALLMSTQCGTLLQAAQRCEEAGCDGQCPISDQQSFMLYNQCVTTVAQGGCKAYVDATCSLDAGPPGCNVTTFQGSFTPFAKLFCGGQ